MVRDLLRRIDAEASRLPRPFVPFTVGAQLARLVSDTGARQVLELGTGRGVSTAYLAAGLGSTDGRVLSLDRCDVSWSSPTGEEVLAGLELRSRVTIERSHTCYTWSLYSLVKSGRSFDVIFIDGSKWFPTVLASLAMALSMLTSSGCVVLDDAEWSYEEAAVDRHFGVDVDQLSPAQLSAPGVRMAVDVANGLFRGLSVARLSDDTQDRLLLLRIADVA